jgi:hypothetical protein
VRRRAARARTALLNFRDVATDELNESDQEVIEHTLAVLRVFEEFSRTIHSS